MKYLVTLLGCLAFTLPCLPAQTPDTSLSAGPVISAGRHFFVGIRGDDGGAGTREKPFATLERARDAVRALKKTGGLPPKGVTVWIEGGDYLRTGTFELAGEDSGTADRPVIYRSYPGQTARLVANTPIASALWKPLSPDAARRVHPKVDPSLLRELDLSLLALTRVDRFAPGDRFTDEWFTIDLFANDRRQPLSQWPNPGENIRNQNEPGWTTCNGSKDDASFFYGAGGRPEDGDTTDELDLDGTRRAARWQSSLAAGHEIWLKGLWRTSWEPHTIRVSEINTAEGWIRFAEPPPMGMGSKYTKLAEGSATYRVGSGKENWFALNLLDEIDQPGEWAVDIKDRKIYYYPPAPLETLRIAVADRDTPVIRLTGAANVRLLGLWIEGGMGHGIEIVDGQDDLVAGCTVARVGGTGIRLERGFRNVIQSNDIFDGAGWGISLHGLGDREKLIPSATRVTNNHIHHIGRLAYREALRIDTCIGLFVDHNLFHDLPKGAVRTDLMNNARFEFNEVHNIALREGDTGAFYNYGGWTTYGNLYRYNFIHHINRANGLYCDDGDSGDVFEKNIIHGGINGTHFGGGHDNIARNNLFIENKLQSVDDRGVARNYRLGTNYEKRLRAMNPDQEPWKSYGSNLRKTYGFKTRLWSDILDPAWHPELPNGSMLVDNVSVASGIFRKPKQGDVEVRDNVMIDTVAAAGFADYAAMDLRTNNPDILKKFPELNAVLPRIGLQADDYRPHVPTRKDTGGLSNRGKDGDLANEDQFVR